ncbi:Outer membrane protein OmpA [Actinomadura mexicana]|uniref:Outer membrane protein OmpA n=2 Tax=Actinomadura mexicana TaxID=134959 RepID=A0A238WL28_9ACTN|nr:Outer membrane protein OmpA [Actinomadura mexicana]
MVERGRDQSWVLRLGVGAVALLLALSACGGGDDGSDPPKTTGRPAGKNPGTGVAVPMAHRAGPAHVELLALARTSGSAVTGQFRIVNDGQSELNLHISLFEGGREGDIRSLEANGIGLLDGVGGKLYMPLRTADGKCLCSALGDKSLAPGASLDVYAVFPAPPAGVNRVTVTLPLTVPMQDVPISNGPLRALPDQTDPASVPLAAPRILTVAGVAEGDEQSVNDDGDKRAVRLSSDVLFALNKADLTPQADELLRGVAKQVDASRGSTVKVDGYTDSSGNDAINQPLSERRAKAVADRLRQLVTRTGVAFQTAGHGSADPVASNSTGSGRRKNRRVTASFTMPPPPPAPAGGQPYRWAPGKPTSSKTAAFTAAEAENLQVEVNSMHRDPAGLTTFVWTLRNNGQSQADAGSAFQLDLQYNGRLSPVSQSTDGISIRDTASGV